MIMSCKQKPSSIKYPIKKKGGTCQQINRNYLKSHKPSMFVLTTNTHFFLWVHDGFLHSSPPPIACFVVGSLFPASSICIEDVHECISSFINAWIISARITFNGYGFFPRRRDIVSLWSFYYFKLCARFSFRGFSPGHGRNAFVVHWWFVEH